MTRAPEPAAGPPGDAPFDLLIRLLKLASLINRPMKEGVCAPGEISQIELKVVMALAGEGALAGHELVEIIGAPAMNVSRAIAALAARGLVEPVADPDNRRRKPVRLTTAGMTYYTALHPAIAEVAWALLGQLGSRQRRNLAALTDSVETAMRRWGAT